MLPSILMTTHAAGGRLHSVELSKLLNTRNFPVTIDHVIVHAKMQKIGPDSRREAQKDANTGNVW